MGFGNDTGAGGVVARAREVLDHACDVLLLFDLFNELLLFLFPFAFSLGKRNFARRGEERRLSAWGKTLGMSEFGFVAETLMLLQHCQIAKDELLLS